MLGNRLNRTNLLLLLLLVIAGVILLITYNLRGKKNNNNNSTHASETVVDNVVSNALEQHPEIMKLSNVSEIYNVIPFSNDNNLYNLPTDYFQIEPVPNLLHLDAMTNTIQDGALYMPTPTYYDTQGTLVSNNLDIDDQNHVENSGLAFNKCSRNCCSKQWGVPFENESDVVDDEHQYVANNVTCSDGVSNSGCACMTQAQFNYLGSRGGNTPL